MKGIKIVVIGAGLIGQKHSEVVSRNSECELVAVCDAYEGAKKTAVQYNVPFYQSHEELLAEQSPDAAIIATPTNLHTLVGMACAERGVHILVEKPIAGTLAEARQLVGAAERHGVQLIVGHHRRHNLLVQQARDIVQGGQIGALVGVTAIFALLKPDDYYHVAWRTQPGGGPILINLIHDIDNLRFICGEIESVYAVASTKRRGLAVEDTAGLTLQFENGALGSVFVSDTTPSPWSYELTSGENPAYPQTGQDCYRFLGTEGSLTFPSMTLWHYPRLERRGWWYPIECQATKGQLGEALPAQLTHFCRVIRGEEQPLISGQEGLKTLAVTQAASESARCRIPISLSKVMKE